MKSLSVASLAGAESESLELARKAVHKNPQALFTAFQWYLYKTRNTVFFSAGVEQKMDHEDLMTMVANMVTLAPQLTHGFVGALPGQPLPRWQLEAITSIVEVDELDGYPEKGLHPGLDIFERKDLPLFRVTAYVRKGGADASGRATMVVVRSSHALMEGSDSALLTRSQRSSHGHVAGMEKTRVPFSQKLKYQIIGVIGGLTHLTLAHLKSPPVRDMGFKSVAIDRPMVRRVANALNVRQRSLMFGLVMHTLNREGFGLHKSGKGRADDNIRAVYTLLDDDRQDTDDDFFRVRTLDATFDVHPDLVEFIKGVDNHIGELEHKSNARMQPVLNATFKAHRLFSKVLPFLYTDRFFRFNGSYGIVLTMVPPHRVYGNLTRGMKEPVYCGSYHPSADLCTLVPARHYMTLNFTMQKHHLEHADKINKLLEQLDTQLQDEPIAVEPEHS